MTSHLELIRALLDERSPADALAVYYGLYHEAKLTESPLSQSYITTTVQDTFATRSWSGRRTTIVVQAAHDNPAQAAGFLVRAQTGHDLFRPLVTFRAESAEVARELFAAGLTPRRPYYLAVPLKLAGHVNRHLAVRDASAHRIYQMDSRGHPPIINVFVTASRAPDGSPRYEVQHAGKVYASAGVNWRSPRFAEVYVYVDPAVRGRGWGKSVVSAVAGDLLRDNVTPLYVVAEDNTASVSIAEAVGFRDTGEREYVCEAIRASEQSSVIGEQ